MPSSEGSDDLRRNCPVGLTAEANHLLEESGQDDWGQISPSIYETARVVAVAPWLDGHAARLRYLCDEQATDGGWGVSGFRLVPTLSAIEALLTVGTRQSAADVLVPREQVARGARRGLEAVYRWLAPRAQPPPLPDTVAIELIVPRIVALINDHLDRHAQYPVLDLPPWSRTARLQPPADTNPGLLERLRQAARDGRPIPGKLWHSWEIFHPGGQRPAPVRLVNGCVSCSPAATAAWLGAAPDPDNAGSLFLENLQRRGGGPVPVATPMPFFERAWILRTLATQGVAHIAPAAVLASLDAALGEYGAPAGYGLPVDGDDTACVLYALALNGYDRPPESMMHYFGDDHFRCYTEERTPSTTTNAHAVEALAYRVTQYPDEQYRYGLAIRKAVDWLLASQNADGSWTDKWHGSPYYATACCAQALSAYGGSRCQPAVEHAVAWILDTEQPCGRWGYGTGTVEETAYAARILQLSGSSQLAARIGDSLAAAEKTLSQGDEFEQSPTLWIGKDVYTPLRLVRVTRVAALHAIRSRPRTLA